MKIPPFFARVSDGDVLPWYYGGWRPAWGVFATDVCWIPFNVPLRYLWLAYLWLRWPKQITGHERKIADLMRECRMQGRREGYESASRDVRAAVRAEITAVFEGLLRRVP